MSKARKNTFRVNSCSFAVRKKPGFCNYLFGKTIILALAASLTTACSYIKQISGLGESDVIIPSAKVVRAPVETEIHAVGELMPGRNVMIVAPPAGGIMTIIQIVDSGTRVNEGDVIVTFDPGEQEYALEQSRSRLDEAEQQIRKMKADQAVRVSQEQVSLMSARYAVDRAEWRTMGNDILGAIEARKNVIALEEAKRRLEQLERDIESRASSDAADLQAQEAARSNAVLEMGAARQRIDSFIIRAPISGVVVLGENLNALVASASADGVIYITEAGIPKISQGDQVSPGSMIAQIQASEQMEIAANVLETEVSSMTPGQAVKVWLDTDPLQVYEGRLKSVAESSRPSASSNDLNYLEALSARSFAAVFEVISDGAPVYPGVTARIIIPGKSADDVLSVPRHALNQKAGEVFVYVRSDDGWKPQTVRVQYLTESRAVIEGVDEGMEVALGDPETEIKKAKASRKGISVITSGASS
ncbi:MAG: HlyD family efflux transporter periplasmic adaptor subunit [Acidobacteria bacterium]|nr:HlyD family efflux transporter periplasmic adaptor subunit [Acidobacteriota bacterium]